MTGGEGTSLPILTNPVVMMPAVTCKSGVVEGCRGVSCRHADAYVDADQQRISNRSHAPVQ